MELTTTTNSIISPHLVERRRCVTVAVTAGRNEDGVILGNLLKISHFVSRGGAVYFHPLQRALELLHEVAGRPLGSVSLGPVKEKNF